MGRTLVKAGPGVLTLPPANADAFDFLAAPSAPPESEGEGTHVAGTIGAVGPGLGDEGADGFDLAAPDDVAAGPRVIVFDGRDGASGDGLFG